MDSAQEQPLEDIASLGFKILSEEERALNFASTVHDEMLEGGKRKISRDPLSHRLIEKRRRDRMNNCLADLSRLIPTYYLKKGRGRIEKTEVIEMAIKYMKHLQAHACSQIETCEITTKQEKAGKEMEQFHIGYQEAMSETLQFLRDSEGLFSGDSLCVRIMNHLNKHCEKIMKSEGYSNLKMNGTISSSSSSSGYHANGSSNGSSSDGNASGSNLVSDCKDVLLTEESAYRSDEQLCSDDREISYTPSGGDTTESLMQGVLSGGYQSPSGPGSNTSSSGEDNNNRLYKFKSNMKHRFSADAEHSSQIKKKRRDSESFCGFTEGDKDRRYSSHALHPNSDPGTQDTPKGLLFQPTSTVPKIENDTASVPGFALSPSGAFYVPISLDNSVLAPYIASQGEGVASSVLHPVSIYVSFCSTNTHQPLSSPQQISPFSAQDAMVPRLHPSYDPYGERCHKEERRRHPGYAYPLTHTHNNPGHTPMHGAHSLIHQSPAHARTEFRQLRTPTEPHSEISSLPQENIQSQLSPQEQRGSVGRLGIRDFMGKASNRPQVSWPYNITSMFKE